MILENSTPTVLTDESAYTIKEVIGTVKDKAGNTLKACEVETGDMNRHPYVIFINGQVMVTTSKRKAVDIWIAKDEAEILDV